MVVVALLLLVRGAAGQVVRGTVVEAGNATPVQGAMVVLLDFDGRVVGRVLSDDSGAFITRADHPGPHTIRVDRIGYESLTTASFDVPVEGVVQRVEVPIRPVELVGLDVEGSRRCSLPAEQGRATARVWEEARKALQAAAWTLSSGLYHYTLLQFERELDTDGRRVLKERKHFTRSTAQAPWVSESVEELAEHGFIRENDDGTATYFAPDAEAFLSDAFLGTHCMRLESVRDGMVGLAFQPIGGRHVPEIRGTLWLEAATATLRRLDFEYVNRPDRHDRGFAGGQVTFGSLPNGAWVVRDWSMRLPMLGMRPNRSRTFLLGYLVQGGTVWRVMRPDGTIVLEAASATVSGTLVDSLEAGPIAGGRVRSAGDPEASGEAIGEDGTFMLAGLPPGSVSLEVHHPSLDTLGIGPATFPLEAEGGAITAARLRLPGVGERVRAACADDDQEQAGVAVLGRVLDRGRPAAGAVVQVRLRGSGPVAFSLSTRAAPARDEAEGPRWREAPDREGWVTTRLDDRGIFLLCGVSRGARLLVQAGLGGAAGEETVAVGRADDALVVTLQLQGGR